MFDFACGIIVGVSGTAFVWAAIWIGRVRENSALRSKLADRNREIASRDEDIARLHERLNVNIAAAKETVPPGMPTWGQSGPVFKAVAQPDLEEIERLPLGPMYARPSVELRNRATTTARYVMQVRDADGRPCSVEWVRAEEQAEGQPK